MTYAEFQSRIDALDREIAVKGETEDLAALRQQLIDYWQAPPES